MYTIAMVCDFFYPHFGGVEAHLYLLSQCLIKRGHKVVIMTHAYDNRNGVRFITNGLKVYYLPFYAFREANTFPTVLTLFPLIRNVFIREKVDIVHGHSAFSSMCHEAIMHARTMGIKTCFTDHSLFGFADASSIHMNKILKFTLSDVDHVICVSHTSKENTVLRAQYNPDNVSVISNAVDATGFTPDPAAKNRDRLTIVVMSRLVYRKGLDLVIEVIPEICRKYPLVDWIIGGDGPKRLPLEEMIEKYGLHDRVELLGEVDHADVRNVLVRGDIFLNSSLTEAFCIAIVEAASCGLLVVSTNVGGVPEVLPDHMIKLTPPVSTDVVKALEEAIVDVKTVRPAQFHAEVAAMYSWDYVAARTEAVYDGIMEHDDVPLIERFRRYYGCGTWAGKIFCLVIAFDFLMLRLLDWLFPRANIDIAPNFPTATYNRVETSLKSDFVKMTELQEMYLKRPT